MFLGQWEKALPEAQAARQLGPDEALVYFQLGNLNADLNRLDEAMATINEGLNRKLENPWFHLTLYWWHFYRTTRPLWRASFPCFPAARRRRRISRTSTRTKRSALRPFVREISIHTPARDTLASALCADHCDKLVLANDQN